MTLVNHIVGWLFELLLQPLRALPPLAGLGLVALVTAIAMLIVFRTTSNQPAIAAAKRRLEAGLFEIRLFDDDPRLVLRALGDLLRANLAYLRRSIVPLLWMFVPLTLAIAQLQAFYGYRAIAPGDAFLLKARLETAGDAGALGASARRPAAQLRVPPGLQVETEDVWLPALAELAWRVRAERAGRYRVELQVDGATAAKDVRVGHTLERLSPMRRQPDFTHAVLYPVEPPLPKPGPVQSIQVDYAARDVGVLAWRLPWLVVFFVLVMAFAWLLKGRFRITL